MAQETIPRKLQELSFDDRGHLTRFLDGRLVDAKTEGTPIAVEVVMHSDNHDYLLPDTVLEKLHENGELRRVFPSEANAFTFGNGIVTKRNGHYTHLVVAVQPYKI